MFLNYIFWKLKKNKILKLQISIEIITTFRNSQDQESINKKQFTKLYFLQKK